MKLTSLSESHRPVNNMLGSEFVCRLNEDEGMKGDAKMNGIR